MLKNKKGQGLAEYAVILVAVTVVSLGAITVLGHNIGDLLATTAAILPGSEDIYDQPVFVGEFIELSVPFVPNPDGINLDIISIAALNLAAGNSRLDETITNGTGGVSWDDLVFERN